MRLARRNSYRDWEVEMRLVFACVFAWFVLVATATLFAASPAAGAADKAHGHSPSKGGSLIVTKG